MFTVLLPLLQSLGSEQKNEHLVLESIHKYYLTSTEDTKIFILKRATDLLET